MVKELCKVDLSEIRWRSSLRPAEGRVVKEVTQTFGFNSLFCCLKACSQSAVPKSSSRQGLISLFFFLSFSMRRLLISLRVPPPLLPLLCAASWTRSDTQSQFINITLSPIICQSGCFCSISIKVRHITSDVGQVLRQTPFLSLPEIWVQGREDFNS